MPSIRRAGKVLNTTLDFEADTALRTMLVPEGKTFGRLLSRLIMEELARREERHKIREQVRQALREDHDHD